MPAAEADAPRYSICTLMTAPGEYRFMLDNFVAHGFAAPDCEFLFIDNSAGNRLDAYAGCNLFLRTARGRYVVLCHQDVELLADGRARLEAIIAELDRLDPAWGLFGNAGGIRAGKLAVRITDRYFGADAAQNGPFPVRCASLDENFMVLRREANLALPRDRHGFHLYGTELCLIAERLGWSAYVVDFHLHHHGLGIIDAAFRQQLTELVEGCGAAFRPRWITTTCTSIFLSGSALLNRLGNTRTGIRFGHRLGRLAERFGLQLDQLRPRRMPRQ